MMKTSSCRLALVGFVGAELRTLSTCLPQGSVRDHRYELVPSLSDADLIIADADAPDILATVMRDARTPYVLFVGDAAPVGAFAKMPRPIIFESLVRRLDDLVEEFGAAMLARRDASASSAVHSAKAKVRRNVRNAQRAGASAGAVIKDVLVFDADEVAREKLGQLLQLFGFRVHAVGAHEEAISLLESNRFAAAFLNVVLDGSDDGEGIGLCRIARDTDAVPPRWTPALVVVFDQASAADPVRAKLAGADSHLVKPIGRGDVARSLVSCGISLPTDARR